MCPQNLGNFKKGKKTPGPTFLPSLTTVDHIDLRLSAVPCGGDQRPVRVDGSLRIQICPMTGISPIILF